MNADGMLDFSRAHSRRLPPDLRCSYRCKPLIVSFTASTPRMPGATMLAHSSQTAVQRPLCACPNSGARGRRGCGVENPEESAVTQKIEVGSEANSKWGLG